MLPKPKLPPLFGRKMGEMWRRRSKVMDDNGHQDNLPKNNKEAKQGQNLNLAEKKDDNTNTNTNKGGGDLGIGNADTVCASSPSFRFYILPSMKGKKNVMNNKKTPLRKIDINESFEFQTPTTQKTTKRMKNETKGGKAMKSLIYNKPCCAITIRRGNR